MTTGRINQVSFLVIAFDVIDELRYFAAISRRFHIENPGTPKSTESRMNVAVLLCSRHH